MARLIPLAEIKDFEGDEPVIMVRGTITKLYGAKRGTNDNGDWSFQRMALKDKTGEIGVMLKGRSDDVPKDWRGKEIIIEAHKSDKGWSGLYAFDDEFPEGKFTRILKVTPTAQIYLASEEKPEGASNGSNRQGQPRAQDGPRSAVTPRQSQDSAPLSNEEREAIQTRAVLDAKKEAARLANLFCIAIDAVEKVVMPHYGEVIGDMPEEQHQAFIGHLIGVLQRDGRHLQLPVRPLSGIASPSEPARVAPEPPKKVAAPPTPPADEDEIPF